MEHNSYYGYRGAVPTALPHINPPTSKQVLDRLADYLTPPVSPLHRNGMSPRSSQDRAADGQHRERHKLWAYKACAEITGKYSKSFYFSARLLPPRKRRGIMALYAFCRLSDDLVDNAAGGPHEHESARQALDDWAELNRGDCAASEHPVVLAWADTRRRFGIPAALPDDLIEGVRMDLTISRYETWDDLWLYCYRVASTVGLMSMYVTGADTMEAVPHAVQLGVALQLTNILRDVGEDARAGRIYLPAEDMAAFGYTEEMLLSGEVNRSFVELMEFEMARAHALYEAAWPGIGMLPHDSRMAVAAAATIYQGILPKIRTARYNVFNHRAHLGLSEKLRALPGIWWGLKDKT